MSLRGALVRRNSAPVPLVSRNYSGFSMFSRRRNDDAVHLAAYESVGTVFAIVHSLAVATAKVDWHLYRSAKSGLKDDRTEVTSHAMIDLWNRPNPFMPRRRFVEMAEQHIDLTGESDIVASTTSFGGKNIPLELWPVRPDRIQPVPDPYEFLKGYVYISPDGERIPLEPYECHPILMPNPSDPYRGLGPIQSVMTVIDSSKNAEEWENAFFENSAEPGGVLEVPESLSDKEFDRLRDQWNAGHKGVGKAHRVALLENGTKWNGTTHTNRDMQFTELRGVRRDTILEAFGFPKPMLGITEDVNRANAEAAEYVFSKWLIEERLDRWRDWLNFQILPLYGNTGTGLEWDYDSPVSDNSQDQNAAIVARSGAAVAMAQAGFDATETLQWLDMPEIAYEAPAVPSIMPPGASDLPVTDRALAMLNELAETHPGVAQDVLADLLRKRLGGAP